LDSGLSTAAYGLLTADNPSTPLMTDFYPVVRSSTAVHTLNLNVQAFTSSHTVTVPDYDLSLSSTFPISSYTATTWNPVIKNATVASYQIQVGYAVKINNVVNWWMRFQGNVSSQSGTFSAIEGLPWDCTTTFACPGSIGQMTNLNTTVSLIMCQVEAGTDEIQFRAAHAASTSVGNFELFGTSVSAALLCSGSYMTD